MLSIFSDQFISLLIIKFIILLVTCKQYYYRKESYRLKRVGGRNTLTKYHKEEGGGANYQAYLFFIDHATSKQKLTNTPQLNACLEILYNTS